MIVKVKNKKCSIYKDTANYGIFIKPHIENENKREFVCNWCSGLIKKERVDKKCQMM